MDITIDFAMAFDGVCDLLENKNLVFLGTSIEKGYDPPPLATGTYRNEMTTFQYHVVKLKSLMINDFDST